MKSKWPLMVIGVLIALCALFLVLLGTMRVHEVHVFQKPMKVQTYGGTNYVIQLLETTVGQVDTGCVLIVYARVENPNPYELTLPRDWFVLVDANKDYHQPVTSGTQNKAIHVPANGVAEKESLSYVVPNNAFEGTVALAVGFRYFTLLKSERPYHPQMKNGHFIMFHQLDW